AWGDARAPVLPWKAVTLDVVVRALRFELTASQRRAIEAIGAELDARVPMRRLLLGDVGTGKTAVAIAAAAQCATAGFQCALLVVDEQQRLGVAQRLRLVKKGQGTRPHLLSLSATPIPRTLALALRGELAQSTLDERPRGRVPVTTEMHARRTSPAVIDAMRA